MRVGTNVALTMHGVIINMGDDDGDANAGVIINGDDDDGDTEVVIVKKVNIPCLI